MIYETLSSGARIGLLAVPGKGRNRITAAIDQLAEEGVLALTAGMNVMRFLPPLVIDGKDVDTVIAKVSEVLAADA